MPMPEKIIVLQGGFVENKGFTLIEVMVAMVLVSMVTLVAAQGLRFSLNAFERANREGDAPRIITALPSLMSRQLQAAKTAMAFQKGGDTSLPFLGREAGLSFVTGFSPQGSQFRGLVRITYLYDQDRHRLSIYEKPVIRGEDLDLTTNPLSDAWDQKLKPLTVLSQIKEFKLQFIAAVTHKKKERSEDWKDTWNTSDTGLPEKIKMHMAVSGGPPAASWVFEVGCDI